MAVLPVPLPVQWHWLAGSTLAGSKVPHLKKSKRTRRVKGTIYLRLVSPGPMPARPGGHDTAVADDQRPLLETLLTQLASVKLANEGS